MNNKKKCLVVIIILLSFVILSFTLPRGMKYEGTKFISGLNLPLTIADWQGKDVDAGTSKGDDRYNFIGEMLTRQYANKSGGSLLLLVLDARDFHYPNVCFRSSGFDVKELAKTEFNAAGRIFKADTIYTERTAKNDQYLIIYWIVIDKKQIPNWVEQKSKQLFFSLFNKKSTGLLIRLDVPIIGNNTEAGFSLAKQFIKDMSVVLPAEKADYLFGEIN